MSMIMMKDKNKGKIASMILGVGKSQSSSEVETEENEYGYGLKDSMNKLIVAIQNGNTEQAAEAFTEAFKICEMQPHEEYSGE